MIQHPLLPAGPGAERREEVPVPTYETLFITPPNLVEEDESSTIKTMSQVVTDGGGSITVAERMGRRRLAYPIREFDEGVYVRLLYDSGGDVPKELERRIRLSENVLRGLTVRLEEDWATHAKEQAVRDAQRRAEAEAAAAAAAEAEAEKAAIEAAKAAAEAEKPEEPAETAEPAEGAESADGEAAVEQTIEAAGEPVAQADEPASEVEQQGDEEEDKS
jgi:small subunit ribosomal protein S6